MRTRVDVFACFELRCLAFAFIYSKCCGCSICRIEPRRINKSFREHRLMELNCMVYAAIYVRKRGNELRCCCRWSETFPRHLPFLSCRDNASSPSRHCPSRYCHWNAPPAAAQVTPGITLESAASVVGTSVHRILEKGVIQYGFQCTHHPSLLIPQTSSRK